MCVRKKNFSLVKILCLSTILSNNFFIIRALTSEGSQCTMNDQTSGICAMLRNCEWWIKKMRNHQYPTDSDRCGFSGFDIIVCCPQRQPTDGPVILPNDDDSHSEDAPCRMETDNGPGVCRAIHRCEFRIDQVRQGKRFDTTNKGRCSFDGDTEIVCCPTNERSTSNARPPRVRPAERACQQYQTMVTGIRNLDLDNHIIGGETAKSAEFPFMVALGYQNDPDNRSIINYICGGSLITVRHVLTAAHCTFNIDGFRPVEVRLGSVSLIDNSQDVQRFSISDIIIHPKYRISRNYFDIAIIIMSQSVTLSNKTMPICLQTNPFPLLQTFLNSQIIATGWGATNFNDDMPSQDLKKTRKLSLIDRQTCGAQYNTSNRIPDGVDDSLLCILDENPVNRSDACHGDSGGPLFLKSTVVSSLIGIVSFGQSCATSVPGIYTYVYFYLDWIEQIAWPGKQRLMG